MTNRQALELAIATLSTNPTFENERAVAIFNKMLEQMDKRNAQHAVYAANARAKKNDQYAEDYAKVVAAFDRIGEPTTLTDAIRMDSDMHANMTTQKLVQVIKHGDGTLVKAKVKGKMLYGRREWFAEDVKIVGEEE